MTSRAVVSEPPPRLREPVPLWPLPPSHDIGRPTDKIRALVGRLVPVLPLYVLYLLVRWLLGDRAPALGLLHAEQLLRFEARLGLNWETALQGAALHHAWLIRAANVIYAFGFLPVLIVAAVVCAWREPAAFLWWRRVFSLSLLLGLVGFATFPVAPPRLLPAHYGFVDTLLRDGPRYVYETKGDSLLNGWGRLPDLVNQYAAMPSLHIAWSALAVGLLAAGTRRRWVVWLGTLWVAAMAWAVIVTANHYVLDVVAGVAVFAISIAAGMAASALTRHAAHRPSACPAPLVPLPRRERTSGHGR